MNPLLYTDVTTDGLYILNPLQTLGLKGIFCCVPGMVQVLRVKVPSRVFTAKCSEPQAEDSNV